MDNKKLKNDIDTLIVNGFLEGSDKLMGDFLYEIRELQERLHLMSVIKSCYGVLSAIDKYGLDDGIIELDVVEHFSEYILTAAFTPPKNIEAFIIKNADHLINGYLSNVRFDCYIHEMTGKTIDELRGMKINLNRDTFRDDYISALLNKTTRSEFENEWLNRTLHSKKTKEVNNLNKI